MCVVGAAMLAPVPWSGALGTPEFVSHDPAGAVFGEPGGVTQRSLLTPREDEFVDVWIRIGYSFFYDEVAIYYTTDGSPPAGSFGTPAGTTQVLTFGGGDLTFIRNENTPGGVADWWRATLPASTRGYGDQIRYVCSAWNTAGGIEVFANSDGCGDDNCDSGGTDVFTYTNLLAWPGKGSPHVDHAIGFPGVHFWKEEGVVGNGYINAMLDANGSLYDIYYPSAGCVQGMGTKNEGYSDGPDTFPPLLPADARGQMNLNQVMPGIRVNGTTFWLSNEAGGDYLDQQQEYVADTNVLHTSSRLAASGQNIDVQQYDFAPIDVAYPLTDAAEPNRGLHIKRMLLTNNGAAPVTVNVYLYADFALNGGDGFDGMFTDAAAGAMVAYDNTARQTSSSGEYNPTTFGDYQKDVSVYLAGAMRVSDAPGSTLSTGATDFWSDTSSEQGRGWIGTQVDLPVGVTREIGFVIVGGFDGFAGATGTYDFQMDNALAWFGGASLADLQSAAESYWANWLAAGTTIDFPDDRMDETFRRGLLATALHLDGENGGIIAGMHNGAYPFVWPRDAAWAAITLARAGHMPEAHGIVDFLTDVAYRDPEPWGLGFWKQKYTTDGYTVWASPQVDETSCFPWMLRYMYETEGDVSLLADNYVPVFEAARAMSENSTITSNLRYEAGVKLMYSMNLWEDSFDTFTYSNVSVVRGLRDASAIADILDQQVCPGGPGTCNYHNDKALFDFRAGEIFQGVVDRYVWDGENTDISQLGAGYPFDIFGYDSPLLAHAVDRMNGVATDTFGNNHPLVNIGGEWDGLINRYWGDGYWNNPGAPNPNGSPWFLTTMWYGCHYAQRQDVNPGAADIDNHLYRMELLLDRLGPVGLGAEQIAPSNSLSYAGQTDFVLQTAWPNAWESMSFFVDAMMIFLDIDPDAPGNTLRIEPKLPSGWSTMSFANVRLGTHGVDVTIERDLFGETHTFTNRTGGALDLETVARVPGGAPICNVTINGSGAAYSHDGATGRVTVSGSLATGVNAVTVVRVTHRDPADTDADGDVDFDD
ncbi:MAG: hypothetical protein KDA21_04570, partial [Phycisphaerales bacterium]|nr:hypothetical protein [Phycisphaerales bacterium]